MSPRGLVPIVAMTCAGLLALGDVAGAGDERLSAKQWRGRANARCRVLEDRSDGAQRQAFGDNAPDETPSLAQMTEYVTLIEPLVEQMLDSIDELREPKSLKKKVKRLLWAGRTDLEALVDDPSRGLEGNPFGGFSLRAEKLGLTSCS